MQHATHSKIPSVPKEPLCLENLLFLTLYLMEQIIQSSILIIETLAASANLYTTILEEMGNRVIVITKGAEAVHYLQNNTPNVLIVDLYMIQVAGTNLFRQPKRYY